MKYMGSKNRIAKYIVPILEKFYYENECEIFIDACCGGCNLIDKVNPNIPRYANDINEYLVEMWKGLQKGWMPKDTYSKDEYNDIKKNKENHEKKTVGWVGICCSYSGKWFGGYAGDYPLSRVKKDGTIPNYQKESLNSVKKQIEYLNNVTFTNKSVLDIKPTKKALIYCDIPYKGTTKYKNDFPYNDFYIWCELMKDLGHIVIVSEYKMPEHFKEIWSKELNSQLSANGKSGGNKLSTEKLFTL